VEGSSSAHHAWPDRSFKSDWRLDGFYRKARESAPGPDGRGLGLAVKPSNLDFLRGGLKCRTAV